MGGCVGGGGRGSTIAAGAVTVGVLEVLASPSALIAVYPLVTTGSGVDRSTDRGSQFVVHVSTNGTDGR